MKNVTLEQFKSYLKVQRKGKWNMFSEQSRLETGLDKRTYLEIIKNYSELMKLYKQDLK